MKMNITVSIFICLLIVGCKNERPSNNDELLDIQLLNFEIELAEIQAITNEGLPVLAPDINFGKIYFNWRTNYKTEKYTYSIYLSTDEILSEDDHHLGTNHCNIAGIPCYPIKEKYCEVIQEQWLKCIFSSTRMAKLSDISNYPEEGFSTFLILKVCPWGAIEASVCDSAPHKIRIEPSCSDYKAYECLDSEPLLISDLTVSNLTSDIDSTPILLHELNSRQKFWLQWKSSWIDKEYSYKIEMVNQQDNNELIAVIKQGICNDNKSCYPSTSIMCEYISDHTTGKLTCSGPANYTAINQIAEAHPFNAVDLKIRVSAFDEMTQKEINISHLIRIMGENE